MDFSKCDLKKLVYFLWKDGLSTSAITQKINCTIGPNSISLSTCQRSVSRFNDNDLSVDYKERCGRPVENVQLSEHVALHLQHDKYATSRKMAEVFGVSHSTILRSLHGLGKSYLANRWLPHVLTDENKANRERIAGEVLAIHHRNTFLHQLITVDEVWVFWDIITHRITTDRGTALETTPLRLFEILSPA